MLHWSISSRQGRRTTSRRHRSPLDASERASLDGAPPSPSNSLQKSPHPCSCLSTQIFSQLEPSSLLQASRISKLFRRMLCSRSVEKIWRRARLREGWTDLDAGYWNEMQYAQFIYGRECQVRPLPGRELASGKCCLSVLTFPMLSDLRQRCLKSTTDQASHAAACKRM